MKGAVLIGSFIPLTMLGEGKKPVHQILYSVN